LFVAIAGIVVIFAAIKSNSKSKKENIWLLGHPFLGCPY
jgi:hypothetical protein